MTDRIARYSFHVIWFRNPYLLFITISYHFFRLICIPTGGSVILWKQLLSVSLSRLKQPILDHLLHFFFFFFPHSNQDILRPCQTLRNICCVSLYLPILHELIKLYWKLFQTPRTPWQRLSPRIIDSSLKPLGLFPISVHTLTPTAAVHTGVFSVPPTNLFHKQNTFLGHKLGVSSSGAESLCFPPCLA